MESKFQPVLSNLRTMLSKFKEAVYAQLSDMEKLIDQALSMASGDPNMSTTTQILVTYRSQWDADAKFAKSDCGPACVAMLLDFLGTHVDIDLLSHEAGLSDKKKYTLPADLVRAAGMHRLTLEHRPQMELAALEAEIRAGRPVIALINYSVIDPITQDSFAGGHWLVVCGFDEAKVILNDPDWWGMWREMGKALALPRALFVQAWSTPPATGDWTVPRQALMVRA